MIRFRIIRASASKAVLYHATGPEPIEKKDNEDIWRVYIGAELLNPEDLKSTKHNKIMPIASTFYKNLREDIGIKTEQLSVGPYWLKKNNWDCNFNVKYSENEEEAIHYMVWYISSCLGREYVV
jgi:hypothetical protein